MNKPVQTHGNDLTREQFFGWLSGLWQLHQDDLAKEAEEKPCEDSKASE